MRLRWALFSDILRVGLAGSVSTVSTNLSIAVVVALVGAFGSAAIAGYGTASRLEYLLIPLVFGLGAPLVAMVGTCIGAGQRERALRAAWIGAALSFAMAEPSACGPRPFRTPGCACSATTRRCWRPARCTCAASGRSTAFRPGPGAVFCVAGAGKLLWPVLANILRLAVAALGGWLVLRWGGALTQVFLVQGLAMVLYGLVNAGAIARKRLVRAADLAAAERWPGHHSQLIARARRYRRPSSAWRRGGSAARRRAPGAHPLEPAPPPPAG